MKTGTIVLLVILVILIGVLVALYFIGKRLEKQQAEQKPVRQCPECFFTFGIIPGKKVTHCPHCGYEFPAASREPDADETIGLVKIEGFKLDLSSPNDCTTYPELLEYAKSHGYKPGWAYYQAKRRGLIA